MHANFIPTCMYDMYGCFGSAAVHSLHLHTSVLISPVDGNSGFLVLFVYGVS